MKIKLREKFINHLLKNGNKKTCEKVLLKSFKELQKKTKKPFKTVVKLSIINLTPVFRIITLKNKKSKKQKFSKEVPMFVTKEMERISWGIKYLLYFTKSFYSLKTYKKLHHEILSTVTGKGETAKTKIDYHKKAVFKKRFLSHFRW